MIRVRRSAERGHANHGWLDTYYTFSFSDYYDPNHIGFRALRVINEDRVDPGAGFGRHGHRDMEILTLVLEGKLQHQDSLGHNGVIRPGQVQRMSAGRGVLHSEVNASNSEPVHLLQIWIEPDRTGYDPSYEEVTFEPAKTDGHWRLLASRDGRDASTTIHQDASLLRASLAPGASLGYDLKRGRHAWVHVVKGNVSLNGTSLEGGDGAAVSDEPSLSFQTDGQAEVLIFDLA
jgi:redox-sensitive bicupin YhaK (pirin superfamily)